VVSLGPELVEPTRATRDQLVEVVAGEHLEPVDQVGAGVVGGPDAELDEQPGVLGASSGPLDLEAEPLGDLDGVVEVTGGQVAAPRQPGGHAQHAGHEQGTARGDDLTPLVAGVEIGVE
jgi:hypothetical protein